MTQSGKSPKKPIGQVLRDNTDALMRIRGVVGIAESLSRGKPCILILVAASTPKLLQQIPRKLEGYPVRIQVSGELRALWKGRAWGRCALK